MAKRDLLSLYDLGAANLEALVARAEELRDLRRRGEPHATRPGRVLAMIFEKASTRTRVSFEIAIRELGGQSVVLSKGDSQVGRGEPVRDTARVLSGYAHAIVVRTFGHEIVEEMARYARVPVINGLTDRLHPCQLLADLQTVYAHRLGKSAGGKGGKGGKGAGGKIRSEKGARPTVGDVLRGARYAWIGDGNNMANSWIEAAAILDLDLALACPKGYEPDAAVLARARGTGRGRITVGTDPKAAAAGRHVISTDVFASMGQEGEADKRRRAFAGFCVDHALLAGAARDAVVLHCLPAHRGEEITDDVLESSRSLVWQESENRLHAQKALLEWLLA